jgi:chlorite dismutase
MEPFLIKWFTKTDAIVYSFVLSVIWGYDETIFLYSAMASGIFYRFQNAAFSSLLLPKIQFFQYFEAIPLPRSSDWQTFFYFGNFVFVYFKAPQPMALSSS